MKQCDTSGQTANINEVVFIATVMPHKCTKSHKRVTQMEERLKEDLTDVWTQNVMEKYKLQWKMRDMCPEDFAT